MIFIFQDWICSDIPLSELACQLCHTTIQLICQIYAPLENSPYHRTLYVFACIQPPCWNDSKSWKCFRGQFKASETLQPPKEETQQPAFTLDWGVDSDWGDDDDDDALDVKFTDLNLSEDANGNVASGAEAIESDIAVAQVESDQIQEIIIETPDEDLLANNTMIPELFSKANNAAKRTGT